MENSDLVYMDLIGRGRRMETARVWREGVCVDIRC